MTPPFTPGPWHIIHQRQNGVIKYWIQAAGLDQDASEANRRLIEKAPDLLAALKETHKALEQALELLNWDAGVSAFCDPVLERGEALIQTIENPDGQPAPKTDADYLKALIKWYDPHRFLTTNRQGGAEIVQEMKDSGYTDKAIRALIDRARERLGLEKILWPAE